MTRGETIPVQETPDCLMCGGQEFATVYDALCDRIWQKPGSFQIQRCQECDIVMTRPRPKPAEIGFYYHNAYDRQVASEGLTDWIQRYRLKVLRRCYPLSEQDTLLDVGCGIGNFLVAARRTTGCQASGIEFDPEAIENARQRDQITYHCGDLLDLDLPSESFQVITFYQSLEHHPQPLAALREASRLLTKGGICVVEVPNFAAWWRPVFNNDWVPLLIPQHLAHFEPHTLTNILRAAGFSKILRQQCLFYPGEMSLSLALRLWNTFKLPRQKGERGARRLLVPLALFATAAAFLLELPMQPILQRLGRSGHQVIIARRD